MQYETKFSSTELWILAEKGAIPTWSIFEDQEENQIIFTGKSFQLYYTDKDEKQEYVGMCISDLWLYIGNDKED